MESSKKSLEKDYDGADVGVGIESPGRARKESR